MCVKKVTYKSISDQASGNYNPMGGVHTRRIRDHCLEGFSIHPDSGCTFICSARLKPLFQIVIWEENPQSLSYDTCNYVIILCGEKYWGSEYSSSEAS